MAQSVLEALLTKGGQISPKGVGEAKVENSQENE